MPTYFYINVAVSVTTINKFPILIPLPPSLRQQQYHHDHQRHKHSTIKFQFKINLIRKHDRLSDGFDTIRTQHPKTGHHRAQSSNQGHHTGNLMKYVNGEQYFVHVPKQDINACVGPLSELQNLNSAGRSKISALRRYIDRFGDIAKETKDAKLLKEVVLQREQLSR